MKKKIIITNGKIDCTKKQKSCKHDWREICWTGKSIMFICIKCRILMLEKRTGRHEKSIRNIELNRPNPVMILPFYDKENGILIKIEEKRGSEITVSHKGIMSTRR